MAVCIFRHRYFTTIISAAIGNPHLGFKTTTVNQHDHPCVMTVSFGHDTSKIIVEMEEWNPTALKMVDRRMWIFTPSILETRYWGIDRSGNLAPEPHCAFYPSSFSIAYDGSGNIDTLAHLLDGMDSRPALEKFTYLQYPEPEKKGVVQIGFDKNDRIVFNLYPVRPLEEVERAAVVRQETNKAWFQKLLGKDWPAFA